ncbi:hypothetical protein J1N35_042451 [Gossypium stocksii]|uniref:phosphogluconate dehydrogenase (NADP(+)-dependent, decarboxylating) n=1 Tax=Gossypium stocksii TaxID=47602 RepID=A0A9D3ZKB9_9ROSI|nr:hypothetical protein J1N35_042451 [Gossypium stocksii]
MNEIFNGNNQYALSSNVVLTHKSLVLGQVFVEKTEKTTIPRRLATGLNRRFFRQGARRGRSLTPGGSYKAYKYIEDILLKVAAQVTDSGPCDTYIGKGGSGNFVKMVHNGIEHGDMQLIAEAYDVLKSVEKLSNEELRQVFSEWNNGILLSFLIEITADIFGIKDDKGEGYLVDKVLDKTRMKGTGKWTVQQAAELSVAAPTIALGLKDERIEAAKVFTSRGLGGVMADVAIDTNKLVDDVRQALYASKICDRIKKAYDRNPNLANLIVDPEFAKGIMERQSTWRRVASISINSGISMPAMSSSLAYFYSYRRERLLDNLVQAQKDYF